MTTTQLGTRDSYVTIQGQFHHWRDHADRRIWWVLVAEELVGHPMAKCVMDDFGNLVRVSEVV